MVCLGTLLPRIRRSYIHNYTHISTLLYKYDFYELYSIEFMANSSSFELLCCLCFRKSRKVVVQRTDRL